MLQMSGLRCAISSMAAAWAGTCSHKRTGRASACTCVGRGATKLRRAATNSLKVSKPTSTCRAGHSGSHHDAAGGCKAAEQNRQAESSGIQGPAAAIGRGAVEGLSGNLPGCWRGSSCHTQEHCWKLAISGIRGGTASAPQQCGDTSGRHCHQKGQVLGVEHRPRT